MAVTFDTIFKVGALFTGGAAITQAQNALGSLEKQGGLANLSLKKMVGTVAGIAAGWFTVDKLTGFIGSSIDAARKAKTAYQGMYDSLSKVPGLQKLGTQVIKEQTDKLAELAKGMEKTGGLASETLTTAFTQLTEKGFSPAKIKDMGTAFEDVIVRVKGIKASADDAAEVAQRFGDAVVIGGSNGADALIAMGILTEAQREKFESLKSAGGRYNFVLGEMKKVTGDTAQAMESMDGIQVRMQNQWKDLKVTIGTPFAQAQDALTGAMDKIKATLLTSATKVAADAVPAISGAMTKVNDAMVGAATNINTAITPLVTKATETLTDFIVKHPQFAAASAVTVAAVGGLAAVSPIAQKINSFAGAVKEVHGAFKLLTSINFGAALGLMTNPAFWVVAGIVAFAAAIYLLVTHWEDVKKACIAAWDAVVAAWGTAATWIDNNVIKPIVSMFGGIVEKIKVGDLWGAFVTWGEFWLTLDTKVINLILGLFSGLVGRIQVGDLGQAFKVWADTIPKWITDNIIDPIIKLFQGMPARIGEALSTMGSAIYNAIVGQVKKLPGGPMILGMLGLKEGSIAIPAGASPGMAAAGPASAATTGPSGSGEGTYKTAGYGPAFGEFGKSQMEGPLGKLQSGDIAVSPDLSKQFPLGTRVNVVDAKTGQVLRAGRRVADSSWVKPGHPNVNTVELWNDRLTDTTSHVNLVRAALGGIMARPGLAMLAERVPEMALPLERTAGSRSLLSAAAAMISPGFGRQMGGGPTSVSVAPVINITGAGQMDAGQIGREVERAMRDPVRSLLDQLKKAKQHEARLAYV